MTTRHLLLFAPLLLGVCNTSPSAPAIAFTTPLVATAEGRRAVYRERRDCSLTSLTTYHHGQHVSMVTPVISLHLSDLDHEECAESSRFLLLLPLATARSGHTYELPRDLAGGGEASAISVAGQIRRSDRILAFDTTPCCGLPQPQVAGTIRVFNLDARPGGVFSGTLDLRFVGLDYDPVHGLQSTHPVIEVKGGFTVVITLDQR